MLKPQERNPEQENLNKQKEQLNALISELDEHDGYLISVNFRSKTGSLEHHIITSKFHFADRLNVIQALVNQIIQ
jgi:hypothetical protein